MDINIMPCRPAASVKKIIVTTLYLSNSSRRILRIYFRYKLKMLFSPISHG